MQGKVKWFNEAKGFGFIESEGREYFVHYKNILDGKKYKTLAADDAVIFESSISPRGRVALNVKKMV